MAKIIEEKIIITLSKIVANDVTEDGAFLGVEEYALLKEAVEGLVSNPSIVVEIE